VAKSGGEWIEPQVISSRDIEEVGYWVSKIQSERIVHGFILAYGYEERMKTLIRAFRKKNNPYKNWYFIPHQFTSGALGLFYLVASLIQNQVRKSIHRAVVIVRIKAKQLRKVFRQERRWLRGHATNAPLDCPPCDL
jgi:hypothetical protein